MASRWGIGPAGAPCIESVARGLASEPCPPDHDDLLRARLFNLSHHHVPDGGSLAEARVLQESVLSARARTPATRRSPEPDPSPGSTCPTRCSGAGGALRRRGRFRSRSSRARERSLPAGHPRSGGRARVNLDRHPAGSTGKSLRRTCASWESVVELAGSATLPPDHPDLLGVRVEPGHPRCARWGTLAGARELVPVQAAGMLARVLTSALSPRAASGA